ncbi:NACHT domain-containing protein [Actinoallomurus rhizosphaericola]|uniref:NACHT domain-containing protein n=1 Tax=Actinoallomurus rhizosphaericola TaxID=2952536 RepID=UPI002092DCC1|nr:NACHT domain-containing protein [Actinoallomurus rhizosphaericola]MCO5996335.1 NACHT domain-containing protein [Actinoallomurus rhizosphaericola]
MPPKENGNLWTGLPKVAWLATFLVPPTAVAGIWRDFVRRHWATAALLLVAYWLVLTVGRFVAGFVRDLVQRRRASWLDGADRALGIRFTRFKRRYLEHLAGSLRKIDQKGLTRAGFYTPELDEVFVDVSLALRAPNRIPEDLLADPVPESAKRRSISEFIDAPDPVVVAIVGAPGSGKTTLLRYTARRICREQKGRRRTVPILLFLRDHAASLAGEARIGLPEVLSTTLGRLADSEPPGWFDRQLRDGNCVVLLDGLDEIASPEGRRAVADWIERQTREYPNNDYVITSRPRGYQATPVDGATVLQTRRFTDDQISRFVHGWYIAIERHASAGGADDFVARSREGAETLLTRLRESPSIYELTANPLLLTMVANVHRFHGLLPGSRSDLYGEICQVMLWRRQEAKKLLVEPRGRQKEMLLRLLAYTMMRRRVRDLTRDDCLVILRSAVRRVSRELSAESFLDDVSTNGLLIERENGVFAFTHFTFQEYLAAAHIAEKGMISVLVEAVDDEWWQECTLLYAARADVSPIVRACLRSGTTTALALAFECADEGNELVPELRDELNAVLDDTGSTDPQRRRLIAGVAVARHLRRIVVTSGGRRVCALPVSKHIYGLFMLDTEENRAPDGDGSGDVVTGVRASDTAAFLNWVNRLSGNESFYRLPTPDELADNKVQRIVRSPDDARCYWTRTGEGTLELWVPDGSAHPGTVDGAVLHDDVTADISGNISVLVALALVRAKSTATAILLLLDAAADLGLDKALARAVDLAAALGGALETGLIGALDIGLNLEVGLRLETPRIKETVAHLTAELPPTELRDFTRELARDLVTGLSAVLERAGKDMAQHQEDLARIDSALRAVAYDLGRDGRRSAPGRQRGTRRHAGHGPVHELSVGHALSRSIAGVIASPSEDIAAGFAALFTDVTDVAAADHIVSPDEMRPLLTQSVADVKRLLLEPVNLLPSTMWAAETADALETAADPVFAREHELTPPTATRLRLSALCLAVEADIRGQRELGDRFRSLAAGVTWLERRRDGRLRATEAMIMASD